MLTHWSLQAHASLTSHRQIYCCRRMTRSMWMTTAPPQLEGSAGQSLELQLQNLRAQNQALQRELLDLPPQNPEPQSSPSHSLAPASPVLVDHNPFNPTSDAMQRTTSPAPAPTSPASGQTASNSPSHSNASSTMASFPFSSPSSGVRSHFLSPQGGRSSPLVHSSSPAALQPIDCGFGGGMGSAERSSSIGSGPASPSSTLNGPSAHGSLAQHPANVPAAPHGVGSSHNGAGRRSPAPSSEASSSTAETDRIMAAVAQRKKDAVSTFCACFDKSRHRGCP